MRTSLTATAAMVLLASCFASSAASAKTSEFVENTLKAFEPSLNAMDGLRATMWKGEIQQVLLADAEIPKIKAQIAKGTMDQHEGEFIIDGYMDTIRSFLHELGNEAVVIAGAGQVRDVPQLQKVLGQILSVARQDQLSGDTEIGQAGAAEAVRIFTTFATAFARNCKKQTYKPEFAMGLQRQLELLGTGVEAGIDLGDCVIPDLAVVEEFELVYEIRTEAAGFASESQDGDGDETETTRNFKSSLKGQARLTAKSRIPSGTRWSNATPGVVDMHAEIDDYQSTMSKEHGEGDSWLAQGKSFHVKGMGTGVVPGGVSFEVHTDGTYNVSLPAATKLAGQMVVEEKQECSHSDTGYEGFCDDEDLSPKTSRRNVVTFGVVDVPNLIKGSEVHHAVSPALKGTYFGTVVFESDTITVDPDSDMPPVKVKVYYSLTPKNRAEH